jgi:hypothetical protein
MRSNPLFSPAGKGTILLLLLTILSALSACKKVSDKLEEFTTLRINSSTQLSLPPAIPVQTLFSFVTPPNRNPNSSTNLVINRASLEKVTLTLTSPSGQTFRFIKSIRFFLQADGLPEVEVANRLNIDDNVGTTLELNVTNAELKQYIKKETFRLRTELITDEETSQKVDIKADLRFAIVILG